MMTTRQRPRLDCESYMEEWTHEPALPALLKLNQWCQRMMHLPKIPFIANPIGRRDKIIISTITVFCQTTACRVRMSDVKLLRSKQKQSHDSPDQTDPVSFYLTPLAWTLITIQVQLIVWLSIRFFSLDLDRCRYSGSSGIHFGLKRQWPKKLLLVCWLIRAAHEICSKSKWPVITVVIRFVLRGGGYYPRYLPVSLKSRYARVRDGWTRESSEAWVTPRLVAFSNKRDASS